MAKIMTKSSEFITQFSVLNDQIVTAIAERKFGRVIVLDKARQDMMQDLCLLAADDVDDQLFDFIEDCARQNTKMIEDMERSLLMLVKQKNSNEKVHRAYNTLQH